MKYICFIGFSPLIINSLKDSKDIKLFILEEEEIYNANRIERNEARNANIILDIIFTKFMNAYDYEEVIRRINFKYPLSAIIPTREYCVFAASKMSEELGLAGVSVTNATILTNKIKLRDACAKYQIPHPRYSQINCKEDLISFFDGKPIIFKPANRQGSLGISKISSLEEIDRAFEYTTKADETKKAIVKRNFNEDFIAEDYIEGNEVSVEALVQNGSVIFCNITEKISNEVTFVESGHIVPACIDRELKERIEFAKIDFVKKLNIQNGILHSEWKICNGAPVLIECAARAPGDGITTLISKTYGFNFFEEVTNVYAGVLTSIPKDVKWISTSRFFLGRPGIIKDISGLEILSEDDKVLRWNITCEKGEKMIQNCASSWDRLGYFFAYEESYEKLEEKVDHLMSHINIEIEESLDENE